MLLSCFCCWETHPVMVVCKSFKLPFKRDPKFKIVFWFSASSLSLWSARIIIIHQMKIIWYTYFNLFFTVEILQVNTRKGKIKKQPKHFQQLYSTPTQYLNLSFISFFFLPLSSFSFFFLFLSSFHFLHPKLGCTSNIFQT